MAHARYLCKRLHTRYPHINMTVGLWLAKGDLRAAKHRLACEEAVIIVTTLERAEHEIDQLAHPIILRQTAANVEPAPHAK